MRLTAARNLKEEIVATLPEFVDRADGALPPVAVGIATTARTDDYRIAARSPTELPPAARRYLERVTLGELDVRVTGPIRPFSSPLAIGASTAHVQGRRGTLGFFARRSSDGSVGLVSNNHVIAVENAGADGDEIVCWRDGKLERVVARLAGDYPRLTIGEQTQMVDCAFARIVDGVDFNPAAIGGGEILIPPAVPPHGPLDVEKIGGTTGRTEGRVTAFNLKDVVVDYSFGKAVFHEQLEIESLTAEPFSRPGDSGSLIFTADRHPIGLLYAGSAIGGKTNAGLTYANPITAVYVALGVTLVT